MARHLRLIQPFLILLAVVATGRWAQGLAGVPYEKGHHVFSTVILTVYAATFFAMFGRRCYGYRLLDAVVLAFLIGLSTQTVIFLSTVVSYALDLNTYWNHPTALNVDHPVGFAQAMGIRLGGLVGNSIFAGIAGALGWTVGALLPERS
jgi:hypothetical protein